MRKILGSVFAVMPLLFGIGFLAPLVAQVLDRTGLSATGWPPSILIGLLVGGVWGSYATWKGRWL